MRLFDHLPFLKPEALRPKDSPIIASSTLVDLDSKTK
jgi:hypothetical protein